MQKIVINLEQQTSNDCRVVLEMANFGPSFNHVLFGIVNKLDYYTYLLFLGVKGLPLLGNLNFFTPKNIGETMDEINIMKLCDKYDGNFKVKVLSK